MELTTAIQSEQHVKKELARRMGELQEELHNIKEQVWSHIQPCRKSIFKFVSFCTFHYVALCVLVVFSVIDML